MSHSALAPQVPAAAKLVSVDGRLYPLESAHLLARAEGGIASTTLVQTFANPHDEPLEVVYTMPLPADGAVTGYTIRIGERVIRGEIQPREKASAAYREALREGKVTGLLEEQRPDTFEQKLGNVPPRTKVEVSIDVLHPLAFLTPGGGDAKSPRGDLGPIPRAPASVPEWEYRFPTVVGVRYHGASGRVGDQQALSPDRGETPARVQLTLTIADESAMKATSASHRIAFSPNGAVVFAGDESLDRDVVVRWPAAEEQVGVRVVEGAGLEGDAGRYALVTVVPPARPSATYRRDVTVLIDASGSMTGLPLELAKVVAGDLLRSLGPRDRFELLAFANTVKRQGLGFTAVTEDSLSKALRWLAAVRAEGGTEMESAIAEAMQAAAADSQRQVVLVTDGQIGFEAEVVGHVAAQQNVRLHAVGVGHAPNRSLTQQAAAAGRGLELVASTHEEAAAAARRLVNGTAGPVLTQLSVTGTAIAGDAPAGLRDVFAGQPLLFTVELSREGGTFDLSGALAGSGHAWVQRIHVPADGSAAGLARTPLPIGALYGRESVARLEREHARAGYWGRAQRSGVDAATLDGWIERVAMRHRIVSRRTSLVAIAEEPSVDPLAPRRRARLAVEVPAGVSAEGVGLDLHAGQFSYMLPGPAVMARAPRGTVMSSAGSLLSALAERVFGSSAHEPPVEAALPESPGVRIEDAQVTDARWSGDRLLLIEFELPFKGFGPPAGPIELTSVDADGLPVRERVEFVPEQSTRLEGAGAGTLVRLVFRVTTEPAALEGSAAMLEWTSESKSPSGLMIPLPVQLIFEVPGREREDRLPTTEGPTG